MADRTPEVYLREHPNPHLRQYRSPRRQQVRPVIVVHTAENLPDTVATDGGAEAVAGFISRRTDPGSYHSLVDSDSLVRLVRYTDEAWHDGTGSNPWSLGLSIATTAAWWPLAPRAWRDGAVEQAAQEAARMARFVHAETGAVVQPQRITRAQSENGGSGFISHAERDPKRRTDPGAAFPWAQFL
ncbi:MAG TPA: N-acetylmuramoyl-L-alanine amidase, partial [Mycobacterium sp.]|nr:N-acetylmuramoyl-L-alanine amidase [Mycobacterium sp.]